MEPSTDEIAKSFDELIDSNYKEDGPGGIILILINNIVIYQRCFGLANVETYEKITPSTNFRLASITKQFTAYGIILLEKRRMLARDDTLDKFFSNKFITKCPYISSNVKIQHLLDHSSGLYDYEDNNLIGHDQWSDDDVLEIITDETYFEPGTQYRYSNTGYILLGLIIEIVSSMKLEDFLDQNIFRVNNMKTSILYNSSKTIIKDRALGYRKTKQDQSYELCDQSPTSATRGDGGIYMSLNDYLEWYKNCIPLLLPPLFPINETSSIYYYNLGWFLSNLSGRIRLHTGNSCGFTHQILRIDDEKNKILIIYLTNIGDNDENKKRMNRLLIEKLPQIDLDKTNFIWDVNKLTR